MERNKELETLQKITNMQKDLLGSLYGDFFSTTKTPSTSGVQPKPEMPENKIEEPKQYPSRARRVVEENDILFSTVRPSQLHYGIIKNPLPYLIASTGFAVLSCKHGSQFNDIFYRFIIKDENIDTLNKIATLNASSYPSINPSDILNLNICMPKKQSILIPLGELLSTYHRIIESNNNQSTYLMCIRDRLLPLLMNGQVVVEGEERE